jgi:hypothetical protein
MLGIKELEALLERVYDKLTEEIIYANRTHQLESLLEKYNLSDVTSKERYIELNRAKILLVGDLKVKMSTIYQILKEYDLNQDHIEHVSYEDSQTYPWHKLKNSMVYTDVFIGPIPHKVTGIANYSSLLAMIESQPEDYPKLHRLESGNELKITKSNFTEALSNSELLKIVF